MKAKKKKKTSHQRAPADDRRGNGDRRTKPRRAHDRVVLVGTPADRRRELRRQEDSKR